MKISEANKRKLINNCLTFSDLEKVFSNLKDSKNHKIQFNQFLPNGYTVNEIEKNRFDDSFMVDIENTPSLDYFKQIINGYKKNNPGEIERTLVSDDEHTLIAYGPIVEDIVPINGNSSHSMIESNNYLVEESDKYGFILSEFIAIDNSFGKMQKNGVEIKYKTKNTIEVTTYSNSFDESYSSRHLTFTNSGVLIKMEPGDFDNLTQEVNLSESYKKQLNQTKRKIIAYLSNHITVKR